MWSWTDIVKLTCLWWVWTVLFIFFIKTAYTYIISHLLNDELRIYGKFQKRYNKCQNFHKMPMKSLHFWRFSAQQSIILTISNSCITLLCMEAHCGCISLTFTVRVALYYGKTRSIYIYIYYGHWCPGSCLASSSQKIHNIGILICTILQY